MTSPRPVIIDTDPGQDDALAILLALASPELEVLGVTAVAGNVPLALTQRNVRIVCELAGRSDVKVYAGASKPLVRPLVTAEYVHGQTGLDGPDLPEPQMALQPGHGVDFIIGAIKAQAEKTVTLCALGPLTNVALALAKAPEIAPRIKEIILMGGGFFEGGNTTPAAEFNIYVDPHAAQSVFSSSIPIVMFPLDCTHQARTTARRIAKFHELGTKVGKTCAEFLKFYKRFDETKYGPDAGPLHDPNVIAYLIKPEMYQGRHINVEIETGSELTMGMTVADWWRTSGRKPNAFYIRGMDDEAFFTLLLERIAML